MPITNNIRDAIKPQITNFTCNGKCSNCGQCCSDFLPISNKEIKTIKRYIEQHKIKECNHLPIIVNNVLDLTCPFRDNVNNKCTIYEVRPEICRNFICSKSMPQIEDTKRLFAETRQTVSMRNVFFNGEPLQQVLLKVAVQLNKGE